ncbi:alpha/beta hydrolase [Candidatus Gracilibacteria bacterium]|nr:alpha/beta hydrolase [Candidatus Gracilibacteria bacterium]
MIKIIIRTILILLVGYIALCTYIFSIQESLIFFPSRDIRTAPRDKNLQDVSFVTQDGVNLNGWFIDNKSDTTIIFFHGNGGNIFHNQERLTLFNMIGVNALLFDYRGYGKSEGSIKHENDLYMDGEAAYQYVISRGIKPANIILWGQSLGGAIAIDTAQNKSLRGIISESTFTSMDDIARRQFSSIPTSLLLSYHFNNLSKIEKLNSPFLVIHSEDDEMIDIDNAKQLFEKIKSKKDFLQTKGSHNGAFSQSYSLYKEKIEAFLKK